MPLTFNSPLVTILVFLSLQFHAILGNDSVRTRHQSPADSVADSDTVPVERPSINSTSYPGEQLLFSDDFDEFDLATWQHELTMGGGGNWEFEFYSQTEQANIHSAACLLSFSHLLVRSLCCVVSANNRSNSFVDDSVLYLQPTLTRDLIGEQNVQGGYTVSSLPSPPRGALESVHEYTHSPCSCLCTDGHVGLLSSGYVHWQFVLRLLPYVWRRWQRDQPDTVCTYPHG